MCAVCLNLKWAFEMLLRTVLEGHDKWDSGLGQHRQSKLCWCCVPPSENNSGSNCLLPFREFSTHLHPSPINCLVYLHLAVQAKWEFALKRKKCFPPLASTSLPFSASLHVAFALFHSLLSGFPLVSLFLFEFDRRCFSPSILNTLEHRN